MLFFEIKKKIFSKRYKPPKNFKKQKKNIEKEKEK